MPARKFNNGHHSPPSDAVLRERVTNNERNILSLQAEVREAFSTMATQNDIRDVSAALTALSAKLDATGRPQWQAIMVAVTVISIVGGLVYWPIREKQSDQAALLQLHEQRIVPRAEHQHEWERQDKFNERMMDKIDGLQQEIWKGSSK